MKQIIWLDMQASSINSAYYSDVRLGFNAKTKAWVAEVCRQLMFDKNQKAITALREHFDSSKHLFKVVLEYGTPNYFNKAGTISSKSMDTSNISKTLIDIVFTEPFHGTGTHKCQNLNIDDRFITDLYVKKVPSSEFYQKLTIYIKPLPPPCV